jgi:hypothetical protein
MGPQQNMEIEARKSILRKIGTQEGRHEMTTGR